MTELFIGLSACCFILGLALWPPYLDVHAPVWPSNTLFALATLLLIGAACTR